MAFTDRLDIRPLALSHAAEVLPIIQDDRMYAYIPEKRYGDVQALQARYARLLQGASHPNEVWLNWVVFLRDVHRPVGTLQTTIRVAERTADVAYVLSPAFWGQGYASEALAWLLGDLRESQRVDTARAQVDARNGASIGVVRKLGFEFEGITEEDGTLDHLYRRSLRDPVVTVRARA